MKEIGSKLSYETPLISQGHRRPYPNADQLIERALADSGLTKTRRRDIASAIRRYGIAVGYRGRLKDLILKPAEIRKRLAGLSASSFSTADKRFRNIRSDLRLAVERYLMPPKTKNVPLSPAWTHLRAACKGHDDLYYGLARFMRYCSMESISPEAVGDHTLRDYMEMLEDQLVLKDPLKIQRQTRNAWNRGVRSIGCWPQTVLSNPRPADKYVLPWNSFQPSFVDDAKKWLARLGGAEGTGDEHRSNCGDPFASDSPETPLKPESLRTRNFQIRQIASAMVASGTDIQELKSLADLIDFGRMGAALAFISARTTTDRSHQKTALLHVLTTIAKYWVKADTEILRRMARAKSAVRPRPDTMPSKNRARLAQFQDPTNLVRLTCLPQDLYDDVRRNKLTGQKAFFALEAALQIEILLMFPLRIKNLASLRLGSHLKVIGQQRDRRLQIEIPDTEVKNGMPLLATLPPESMPIFDAYMELARPHLSHNSNDWLFPGPDGLTFKHKATIGRRITRTIKDRIGLDVNPHCFRHIDTLIFLTDRPGHYEDVRRVLGHYKTESLQRYYADLEVQPSVDRLHDSILRIRQIGQQT